jgi:hypothetical protein
MTSPRLAPGLSPLVALALLAPAACVIENPGFIFGTEGAGTGTGSASSPDTTATTAADTGAATDPAPTSSTAATLPSDTTTLPPDSTTDATATTAAGSTGLPPDCTFAEEKLLSEADGYYIAGGTLGGTTCDYPAEINGDQFPCKDLNFGLTPGLRMTRSEGNFDAMFVVRFPKASFMKLKAMGVTSATAELVLNMYAAPPAIDLRVGMIEDPWVEGVRDGTVAQQGDSSFQSPLIGIVQGQWSDPDGPRGASTEVAVFPIPANYPDHTFLESGTFAIDSWLAAPEQAEGLVVSFYKGDGLGTEGPSINTREDPDVLAHPFLRVHYCMPMP